GSNESPSPQGWDLEKLDLSRDRNLQNTSTPLGGPQRHDQEQGQGRKREIQALALCRADRGTTRLHSRTLQAVHPFWYRSFRGHSSGASFAFHSGAAACGHETKAQAYD